MLCLCTARIYIAHVVFVYSRDLHRSCCVCVSVGFTSLMLCLCTAGIYIAHVVFVYRVYIAHVVLVYLRRIYIAHAQCVCVKGFTSLMLCCV